MRRPTFLQFLTVVAILAYLFWEFYADRELQDYPGDNPVAHADRIFFLPVLFLLVLLSLLQIFRKKK